MATLANWPEFLKWDEKTLSVRPCAAMCAALSGSRIVWL